MNKNKIEKIKEELESEELYLEILKDQRKEVKSEVSCLNEKIKNTRKILRELKEKLDKINSIC